MVASLPGMFLNFEIIHFFLAFWTSSDAYLVKLSVYKNAYWSKRKRALKKRENQISY